MLNFQKITGTYKGTIGELMFGMYDNDVTLTCISNRNKYISSYYNTLTGKQKDFLESNWKTIDAIKFRDGKFIIYEVKMKNWYRVDLKYKFKITKNSYDAYKYAETIGFSVKLVIVRLFQYWEFAVCVKDFLDMFLYVDSEKNYDKLDANHLNPANHRDPGTSMGQSEK